MIADLWNEDPEDLFFDLFDLDTICDIDCAGFRWQSRVLGQELTLHIYRENNPFTAASAAVGGRSFYLGIDDFDEYPVVGTSLPPHSWAGAIDNEEFIFVTSQGPAVITFFWTSTGGYEVDEVIDLITSYAVVQVTRLRENFFLTPNPLLTPIPGENPFPINLP